MSYNETDEFLTGLPMSEACVFIVLSTVLALAGIFGNCLVIAAFCTSRKLRTRTNFFLLSLAVADLCVSAVCVPLWNAILYALAAKNFGPDFDHIISADLLLEPFFCVASIMNLLAISFVRLYAVLQPIRFDGKSRKGFAIGAIVFPWGMALLFIVWHTGFSYYFDYRIVLITVVLFFLPLVMMIVNYAIIIRRSVEMVQAASSNISSVRSIENLHTVKMLVIVVSCFAITWCPFFSTLLIEGHCTNCLPINTSLYLFIKTLQYSNSVLNPVIFTYGSRDFKEAYMKVLSTVLPCFGPQPTGAVQEDQMEDDEASEVSG